MSNSQCTLADMCEVAVSILALAACFCFFWLDLQKTPVEESKASALANNICKKNTQNLVLFKSCVLLVNNSGHPLLG